MARLSKEQWESLKADYVTGRYSVNELAKKYGLTHTAINKKIKKENWIKVDNDEFEDLVKEKAELQKVSKSFNEKVSKVSKKVSVETGLLEREIEEEIVYRQRILSAGSILLEKATTLISAGKVEEIAVLQGEFGDAKIVEREINPKEIKALAEAIDKIGQTLGVVPRFNSQINIQNNQSIENRTLKIEVVKSEDK